MEPMAITAEVVFAMRMFMVKYNLGPIDVLGILAKLDKKQQEEG